MAASALNKITARAKKIRKAHPSMKWIACVKQASREYNSGSKKIAGVRKKKAAPRKKRKAGSKIRRKKVGAVRTRQVRVTIGSVAQHKSALKKGIRDQLERKAGRRELAIKTNERKKLSREISKLKKDYRALC